MAKANKVEVQKGPIQPKQPNPYKNPYKAESNAADLRNRSERLRGQMFENDIMTPKQ
jgi:hypothetical protein